MVVRSSEDCVGETAKSLGTMESSLPKEADLWHCACGEHVSGHARLGRACVARPGD